MDQNILVKNIICNAFGQKINYNLFSLFGEIICASLGDFCPGYFAGHGFQPKTITTNHFPHAA